MLNSGSSGACPPADGLSECRRSSCLIRCGLEVLDSLLALPGGVSGEEADELLDLRHLLCIRRDAESTLRLFCDLRRRMEHRHYLAFYRLRRWLETQIVAVVQASTPTESAASPTSTPALVPLRLHFYCVEPVRRHCLCNAIRQGLSRHNSRLSFAFIPSPQPLTSETAPGLTP